MWTPCGRQRRKRGQVLNPLIEHPVLQLQIRRGPWQAEAPNGGRSHAPVVAVLVGAAGSGRRVHGGPQRTRTPGPLATFSLQSGRFLGTGGEGP
jgi:hypothetical protein